MNTAANTAVPAVPKPLGIVARFFDGDVWHSFKRSPVAIVAAVIALIMIGSAVLAPVIAPHDVFDLSTVELGDARLPPAWSEGGKSQFVFGTDDQGRDILSTIMYGSRISLTVGLASVAISLVLGVTLGLLAGYVGGRVDAIIMRVADVQLSFPAILIASCPRRRTTSSRFWC
jgi:peptide/nickel transport system permease protein